MENKLYRSRTERMLFGVCGGLGKYLGIDPTIIRIIFVLLVFCGGIGVLAYIVMSFLVPLETSQKSTPRGVVEENVEDIRETATKLGNEIRDTFTGKEKTTEEIAKVQARRRSALGIVIIVIGVICLLGALNIFSWFNWWGSIGALVLIAIGVSLIVGLRNK
ncbi:MAG: PspC domain-containing protein [Chloroflexi bacterium]|nr:PspC domain-containing protein [Chloroflexota bacterium]